MYRESGLVTIIMSEVRLVFSFITSSESDHIHLCKKKIKKTRHASSVQTKMDQHPATTFHLKQTKTPQNKTKLRNESLLARYFGVEAAETNSKRLKSRDWILIIHGEYVFSHFPELEDDIILLLLSPTTTTGPIVLKGR